MTPGTIAIGAGQGIGSGIGLWAAFRFIRWLSEFVCGRLDRKADRLETRERQLEDRFNSRLRHVEAELARTRDAMMHLLNALADKDPTNPALRDVGRILRRAIPVRADEDQDADLMDQLNNLPGSRNASD